MAFKNLALKDMPKLGQRLMGLEREERLETPAEIAQTLYERFYELVKPGERKNKNGKNVKSQENDIKAIIKTVQSHLNEEDAYNVQSKFMYAYSQLFDCSIDYLYGITEVKRQDMDIRQICEKTGLSEQAVINIVENCHDDPEVFSMTIWWSKLLEDDAFYRIPMDWSTYSHLVLEGQDLQKKINAIDLALKKTKLDETLKIMQEMRCDTLEKLKPSKEDACYGAFGKMIRNIENYLDDRTTDWISKQHKEFCEMYYNSEINKMKILEAALK